MLLEVLKRHVGIEHRVAVVQTRHEADRNQAVGHRIEEAAAELFHLQRIPHRVDDRAGCDPVLRKFPQLLDAECVELRLTPFVERESAHQRLCQVAAHAVTEDRDPRFDIDARLERRFFRTVFVDP